MADQHTTGRVIIRTSPNLTQHLGERIRSKRHKEPTLEEIVGSASEAFPGLFPSPQALIRLIEPIPKERLIQSVEGAALIDLEVELQEDPADWDPQASLLGYWVLDLSGIMKEDEFLFELNTPQRPEISLAYSEPVYKDPNAFTPRPTRALREQRYLNPNPEGINAKAAWALGCTGEGVRLGDVETEWNLSHKDLKPATPGLNQHPLVFGDDYAAAVLKTHGDHGTKVLGVLVASDNRVGVVGIAPHTGSVFLASRFVNSRPPSASRVSDAIVALLDGGKIGPGDVLLLEVETSSGHPVEVVPDVLQAILRAVRRGVVVVEPAGNGDHDLDQPLVNVSGWPPAGVTGASAAKILNPKDPNAEDSGAIMVGAADIPSGDLTSLPYHARFKHGQWGSNYGARVDCYAQGRSVVTTVNGRPWYGDNFGKTSAAASIIAGAAILAQQIHRDSRGGNLSSECMRSFLSDSRLGFGSDPGESIGVMPDLGKVATHLGNLATPVATN